MRAVLVVDPPPPGPPVKPTASTTSGSVLMMSTTSLQLLAHGLKRDILGRLDRAGEAADVLFGEEALGNVNKQDDIGRQGEQGQEEHEAGVPQGPAEGSFIGVAQEFEHPFAGPVEAPVGLAFLRPEEDGAHHGGGGQGEQQGDQDGARKGSRQNSRNSRPTMPPINRRGMKTATREVLMEMTVKAISLAPSNAARNGVSPFSM